MRVEKINYNDYDDLFANTYLVIDDLNQVIVIDPSADNNKLCEYIKKNDYSLKGVLLTHGHFDHMRGVNGLINEFHCPLYIHADEKEYLNNPRLNCSSWENEELIIEAIPTFVKDNQELSILNGDTIKVIHTPFHTRGSVCYYFLNNKWLFSGDTLFKMSIGRDDLPGAMPEKRRESLEKLKTLPKECKIYPGHGVNSTLESELLLNRFFTR